LVEFVLLQMIVDCSLRRAAILTIAIQIHWGWVARNRV